jgi:hypothetical protein
MERSAQGSYFAGFRFAPPAGFFGELVRSLALRFWLCASAR